MQMIRISTAARGLGTNKTGAGKAVGTMSSVGIDQYGKIVASYTNGDIKTIGQIARYNIF